MSVHLRKDGRWAVVHREDGKVRWEYFGRGLEGERKARERNDELDLRPYQKRTPGEYAPTFEDLANQYLEAKQGLLATSSSNALYYKLKSVILPELGTANILALTMRRMDQYVARRLQQGVKRTTVHRELSDIQAIINWAVSRRHIMHNPIAGYKKPTRDDEIINPPTLDEINRLLQYCPPHLVKALVISYYTGIRPGATELLKLTWADVDFKERTILIRSSRKGGPVFRRAPLHPVLTAQLKKWRRQAADSQGPIITFRGRPVNRIIKSFRTAKEKAGIRRKLTPYAFRHAFATAILSMGGGTRPTADILGHSRPDTTARIYQHSDMTLLRSTVEMLPAITIPKNKSKKHK